MKTYLVTGGCGFIGSNFINYLFENNIAARVINLDKMTYAGNNENLLFVKNHDKYHFIKDDICNKKAVKEILSNFKPDIIVHFAAESHVDRSIDGPDKFIKTNVVGTFNLLHESCQWSKKLDGC